MIMNRIVVSPSVRNRVALGLERRDPWLCHHDEPGALGSTGAATFLEDFY
jgi:hypothetical protein